MKAEFKNGKLKLIATCGEDKSFLERIGKFNYIKIEASMVSLSESFVILVEEGLHIAEIHEMLDKAKNQLDAILDVCEKEREKILDNIIKL